LRKLNYSTLSILTFILASCTSSVDLKSIDYSGLLDDGNSKVWIISEEEVAGTVISDPSLYRKKMIVFHNSGVVNMIPVNALGDREPERGYFFVNSDKKILNLEFKKELWVLEMVHLTEDSIVCKALSESDLQVNFKLIPFPEL